MNTSQSEVNSKAWVWSLFNTSFYGLDSAYLKKRLDGPPPSLDGELEAYIQNLCDLDFALTQNNLPDRQEYPYYGLYKELERPVEKYLRQPTWQMLYLDWVLINGYLEIEAISFVRDLKIKSQDSTLIWTDSPKFSFSNLFKSYYRWRSRYYGPIGKKDFDKVAALFGLADHVTSMSFSPTAILKECVMAIARGCFVHPFARALLERLVRQNCTLLTFPSEARTPHQIQQFKLNGGLR